MSFWIGMFHRKTTRTTNTRKSLRTVIFSRRMSPSASVTIEAAMVMPLFLFFFCNILMMFDMLRMQCNLEAALHQTGNRICLGIYEERNLTSGESAVESIGSAIYAGMAVREYLKNESDVPFCVTNGADGVSLLQSQVCVHGDQVDLLASYQVHPMFAVPGFTDFALEQRYFGHAWTGYDISGGHEEAAEKERYVFVTEEGSVYHTDIRCSYLNPSIRCVSLQDVQSLRSKDRSKYYACDCCKGITRGNVYITDYGVRYHASITCPGLKRTIYTVPLSQVEGILPPCSRCGF